MGCEVSFRAGADVTVNCRAATFDIEIRDKIKIWIIDLILARYDFFLIQIFLVNYDKNLRHFIVPTDQNVKQRSPEVTRYICQRAEITLLSSFYDRMGWIGPMSHQLIIPHLDND